MMAGSIVVLVLNRNLATELLGAIAFLGSVAVLLSAMLDLNNRG
jgi:hypothetical protein